jgi:uncharacterized tellurite resistance protein B-like protein
MTSSDSSSSDVSLPAKGAFFSRLKDLFVPVREAAPAPSLDRLPLATCVLLLEAANADDEFTETERERILDVMRRRFSLSESEAHDLIELSDEERKRSADLWHFTHQINETCSRDEKLGIMQELWRVIYADGILEGQEDHLVHRLAKLLNFSHPELIDAKLAVLNQLRGEQQG